MTSPYEHKPPKDPNAVDDYFIVWCSREAVLRFIADEWMYSRRKEYVRFEDIVRAFDNDVMDLLHAIRQLERTDWIEIVSENGIERYKPLARP